MNANPLKREFERTAHSSLDQKLSICADYNRRCRNIGWPRWYYVEPATDVKPAEIRTADGSEAEEVWTILAGKKIDYCNWPQHRLDEVERRARWLIQHGAI